MTGPILLVRLHGPLVGAAGHPRNPRPPWPLKLLQALAARDGRPGVRLVDLLARPEPLPALLARVARWRPEVVVVQATTLDLADLATFVGGLRAACAPRAVIVVGQAALAEGPHAPGALPGVDLVVPGEPEEVVHGVLRALDRGADPEAVLGPLRSAAPAVVERPGDLPHARWTRADLHDYRMHYPLRLARRVTWGHVLATRGCPNACVFCSPVTRETWGRRLRTRPPGDVADEVAGLARLGVNVVCFDDDDLSASRDHLLALCDALGRAAPDVRWVAHARVDELDEGTVDALAAAGCVLLRFGVEAASDRVLAALRKPRGPGWQDAARAVFARCRAAGIGTTALFLVGNPDETRDEAEATLRFAVELAPDLVQFHWFTPYPGSDAWTALRDRIPTDAVPSLYHYSPPPWNPSAMGDDELRGLLASFYRRFLARPSYVAGHARRHLPFYLHNPDVLAALLPRRRPEVRP